jgi:hypothetical protein
MTPLFVASAVLETSRRNGNSATRSISVQANRTIGFSYHGSRASTARISGPYPAAATKGRLIAIGAFCDGA